MHDSPTIADEIRRPIVSLIGKSEKAVLKLTPRTWQHTMLRDNLAALHLALSLMDGKTEDFPLGEYQKALRALASMIEKVEQTLHRFAPGTAQHTLLRNRLVALRTAMELVKKESVIKAS